MRCPTVCPSCGAMIGGSSGGRKKAKRNLKSPEDIPEQMPPDDGVPEQEMPATKKRRRAPRRQSTGGIYPDIFWG